MHILYSYLAGYATAFVLALFSAISVSVFLIPIAPPLVVALCTGSCFFLNLMLFWREFPSILESLSNPKNSSLAKFTTLCSSLVIYAFSYFSFQALKLQFTFVDALLPLPLVHTFSLLSAVGFYGLYINDCTNVLKGLKTDFPKHVLWVVPLMLSFTLTPALQTSALALLLDYLFLHYDTPKFHSILAAFASATLCVFGYGAYLPMLYAQITHPTLKLAAQLISAVGMLSLLLCDMFFSMKACGIFNAEPKEGFSGKLNLLKGLSVMNALANSQLSAQGKGFFSIGALMGGIMSYITMHNSVTRLYHDTEKKEPPYSPDSTAPLQLFGLHIVVASAYGLWLHVARPIQFSIIKRFLRQPILISATYGSIGLTGLISCHMGLASINTPPKKQLPLQEDRPGDSLALL